MDAKCIAPLDSAVPCCNRPCGTTEGTIAAAAGRSKAAVMPKTTEAV